MTYLEKLESERPNTRLYCLYCHNHSCSECWNREIPETIKENKEKETNMKPTENMTNAKIIEAKNDEIKKLKKEIKDLERYKSYSNMADEISAVRKSFIDAGFGEAEAFQLTLEFTKNGMAIAMKNMI